MGTNQINGHGTGVKDRPTEEKQWQHRLIGTVAEAEGGSVPQDRKPDRNEEALIRASTDCMCSLHRPGHCLAFKSAS